jgi:hypothetical protein
LLRRGDEDDTAVTNIRRNCSSQRAEIFGYCDILVARARRERCDVVKQPWRPQIGDARIVVEEPAIKARAGAF